ncbi:MAG: hypothetical protein ACR2PM_11225 [Hyphomicrobiales bacterium]
MNRLSHCVFALSITAFLPIAASMAAAGEASEAAADFRAYCAPCHGVEGRGDGPVAVVLKTVPSALTLIGRRYDGTFPTETIYARVEGLDMPAAHGSSEMPVWGLLFTNQAVGESILLDDARTAAEKVRKRIRAIVTYIETIQE